MAEVGRIFAAKANAATGPTAICVPMHGFSVPDTEGGDFWDPDADAAFVAAGQHGLHGQVRLQLIEAHINDDTFIDAVLEELIWLIGTREKLVGQASTDRRVTSINP